MNYSKIQEFLSELSGNSVVSGSEDAVVFLSIGGKKKRANDSDRDCPNTKHEACLPVNRTCKNDSSIQCSNHENTSCTNIGFDTCINGDNYGCRNE